MTHILKSKTIALKFILLNHNKKLQIYKISDKRKKFINVK